MTDTGADRKKTAENRSGSAVACIIVIAGILLSCLTALFGADILPDYQDKLFHLRRLAALARTLQSGYFPARIYFVMNQGTGYAMPVFYPDLFLYVPAFMVNAGVPLGIAYDIYVILINAVTGVVTYLSVKGILKGEKITSAVIGFVYTLSVYRLTDVYIRDAAGEYTAMAFLPFVIFCFVRVYRDENKTGLRGMLKNAALLGISMALLAESHILTTVMAACFLAISAAILFKKTFSKKILITLILSVVIFAGLTAYSFVPMIDFMRSDTYLFNESSNIMRGFYPGWRELLEIIPSGSGSGIAYELRMPTAIGPAITAILAAWFIRTCILLFGCFKKKGDKKKLPAGFVAESILFAISAVSLFISSKYFPWTRIEQSTGILKPLFCSVQFSWRYIGICTVCACMLAAFLITDIKMQSAKSGNIFGALLIILAVVPAVILQVRACSENGRAVITKGEEIGIVSDELYFPVSWNREARYDECPAIAGGEVLSYARAGGDWLLEVKSTSDETVLVFPVVYYKGYVSKTADGEKLPTMQATDGRVMVIVPGNYEGSIKLEYKESPLWKFAETISLISIVAVSIFLIVRKKSGGDGN